MRTGVLAAAILLFGGVAAGNVEPGVTVESFSPHPAEPGDTVRMHVTVSNAGDTTTTFAPVGVETVAGIQVIGTTDAIGSSITLCGGCQRVGTVRLKVDEDAVSGTYPVAVQLATPGGDGVVETAELEVDGTPNLVVSAPQIETVPGENVTAAVTVRNIGADTASQTVVELAAEAIAMQPSPVEFGRIAPGTAVTRTVRFTVDESFSNGIRQVGLDTSYRDESVTHTGEASVTLDVLQRADVVLSEVAADGATVGSVTDITATVENLGPGEAERIVAELACGGTATVLSGRSFVGQLDDEESVPVTFTLRPTTPQPGCDITVQYTDADRQSLTESFTFPAAEQQVSPVLLGAAAVAVLAVILYWRRTRKQDELAAI
ncbi:MAG: CARDB domain-containing protein [Candidatus Nanohaloarchaea archaeon]|nr:CARDB domain-containing protein [Candidatus Nanohaloarchaea archaeon]